MPGAERVAGAHQGGTLVGGPPRCTWHITADKLDPRPTFDNVRDYLVRMNFEPTLLWDPETGRVAEFLPASHSAYAVLNKAGGVETNRYGDVHVQIEVFFSPGYKGRVVFTDGLLIGLGAIMSWLDGLGIPRVAAGNFAKPTRDVNAWLTKPGHYGHFNVPENDHVDPIAGTDIDLILATGTTPPPDIPPEDDMATAFYMKEDDPNVAQVWVAGPEIVHPQPVTTYAQAREYGIKIIAPPSFAKVTTIRDGADEDQSVWLIAKADLARFGLS